MPLGFPTTKHVHKLWGGPPSAAPSAADAPVGLLALASADFIVPACGTRASHADQAGGPPYSGCHIPALGIAKFGFDGPKNKRGPSRTRNA